ncbi:FAD/NAD(P)-binding protein [Adhaeribacter soli]|uniref:FAD-dependent urate hydroxylase HpyO/Asp monooxygenase CreE-like FAD/NAD(P)-binding domain-containing protein n=1 Tax=Adhaeribacter soli TaxID=2607655 RepID=A0A5N1IVA0_9BACT|nr:FAD/NAD(P)-binding protein [Adhaeribacter soli]KAA9333697.1 hypothetical protein F0P94_10640 [Adhaeribacter soli]
MASEKCVTIIGGGFSGTLTAVQLLRQTPFPISVKIVNTGYPLSKGVAYSAESNLHLLNVRSGRMSAFPHQPKHFVHWLENQPDVQQYCQPGECLADAFMPRKVYGRYIAYVLDCARDNMPAGCRLQFIEDEALEVTPQAKGKYQVTLKSGEPFLTEKVVFALGNFAPSPIAGLDPEVVESSFYFGNPWKPEALTNLKQNETVMLIGTGLTMVDVVLSLLEQKFAGRIIAFSPKGYLPMEHRHTKPYPDFRKELQPPYKLARIYPEVKRHIRQAISQGSSCEALIDSLRPLTQEIWQELSLEDKQTFLRHLSSLWSVFRHRLSPQVAARIQEARQSGQLEIRAARLQHAAVQPEGLTVKLKERGQLQNENVVVHRLINCTGPQCNYEKIETPLVQQLLQTRLLQPDELHLGLLAGPEGKLIQKNGKPSNALFTIGPALRGALWESTAVPEISEQAAHLAQTILHAFMPAPETKTENTGAKA